MRPTSAGVFAELDVHRLFESELTLEMENVVLHAAESVVIAAVKAQSERHRCLRGRIREAP